MAAETPFAANHQDYIEHIEAGDINAIETRLNLHSQRLDNFVLDSVKDVEVLVAPTDGQALVWNATRALWVPGTVASGGGGGTGGAVASVAGKTGAVTLDKTDVGLTNVNNTADSAKPVSSAQQTALDRKLSLDAQTVSAGDRTQVKTNLGLGDFIAGHLASTDPLPTYAQAVSAYGARSYFTQDQTT